MVSGMDKKSNSNDSELLDKFMPAAHYIKHKHPTCVDILHILSPGGEYDSAEIKIRIGQDPARYLEFMRGDNLVINKNNKYEITKRGETLLNAIARDNTTGFRYAEYQPF